ncbi:hypothetical protein GCM10009718_07350 [Isoptericola halotolerans]|uniref:PH (Pleckstrin Homology) domain-containing protein n=1 Tax=Isoptericola halotolerans TaxID=300560 RepID=A0ABX2A0F5_9MICO|nr:STM3941 family protein [Isoptericola halotolerans]NOV96342.1 hypothetical protein [Isoptericola halotolerans]
MTHDQLPEDALAVVDPSRPMVLRTRRVRAFLLALAALVGVLVGLVMAVGEEPVATRVFGVVVVMLSLYAVWVLLRQAFVQQAEVRLDDAGLHIEGHPTIAWQEITELSAVTVSGQPMLGVHVEDEDGLLERFPAKTRALARANRKLAGTPVTVAVRNFGTGVEELGAAVEVYRRAHTAETEGS